MDPAKLEPAQHATLTAWLIYAPGQAAGWDHYLLAVVHLRPIEGTPPAKINGFGYTHEFLLCALDPERKPVKDDAKTWAPIYPVNACVKFMVGSDADAVDIADQAVAMIVRGLIPAEAAFPNQGQQSWSQIITSTAEHKRTGGHHE